jgi:serine/threonine protein kinase
LDIKLQKILISGLRAHPDTGYTNPFDYPRVQLAGFGKSHKLSNNPTLEVGEPIGTPGFMPPEIEHLATIHPNSDQFSAARTLESMLAWPPGHRYGDEIRQFMSTRWPYITKMLARNPENRLNVDQLRDVDPLKDESDSSLVFKIVSCMRYATKVASSYDLPADFSRQLDSQLAAAAMQSQQFTVDPGSRQRFFLPDYSALLGLNSPDACFSWTNFYRAGLRMPSMELNENHIDATPRASKNWEELADIVDNNFCTGHLYAHLNPHSGADKLKMRGLAPDHVFSRSVTEEMAETEDD